MMIDVEGDAAKADLYYRRGSRVTDLYPEVAKAASLLPFPKLILDGELVCLDENARPDFSRLQQRSQLRRTVDIASAAVRLPATFHAFDILALGEFDLRSLPLVDRKAILKEVIPRAGPLRYSDHVEEHGADFFAEVERLGLEGVVAKKKTSSYSARRSADWRKFKSDRVADFVVIGFTPPEGSRTGFGALHLAYYEAATVDPSGRNPPELRYAGRVGSGFTEDQLRAFHARLVDDVIAEAPCPVSEEGSVRGETFVRPRHVVEVRYKTWTAQEHLRQPVFLRWRDDKSAAECVLAGPPSSGAPPAGEAAAPPPGPDASEPRVTVDKTIHFTNLTKVFWPKTDEDPAYTKGDLIDYYRRVAPWFLPYLADRPITLTRYPDGINGKSFFQKDAPPFIPGWVRTERLWNEDAQRDVDLIVGGERESGDLETLLFLANLGTIVLHAWNARVSSPAHPDWIILDLDPKDAPFLHVVTLARAARALCDDVGLPSFAKTTGSSGLHVLIPTGGALTHEQCKTFAELLARVIVTRHETIATVIRNPALRGGKVYVDFLQNGHGKLLVAPFSVRPLPRAPVSMPLRWEDVTDDLTPRRFTIANAIARLESLGDPLAGVLSLRPDLLAALARLGERLG
jgi:bifunctional non-homologous end joining protein LigD